MITDGFQWEDTHLPTPLAQVTASDRQVRPLAAENETLLFNGVYCGHYHCFSSNIIQWAAPGTNRGLCAKIVQNPILNIRKISFLSLRKV